MGAVPGSARTALLVAGTSHDHAGVELRERIAFPEADLAAGLDRLRDIATEGLILSTCNRTEVYALVDHDRLAREPRLLHTFLALERDIDPRQLDDALYAFQGRAAARHLCRVACGLDSLVLGEPHILTQVQHAWDVAHEQGATGPILSRLASDALHAGKLARTESGIARNRTSIPHAAVDLASRRLGTLRGRRALVVGAGEMATLAARLLGRAGVGELTIVNRTPRRADAIAGETGAQVLGLDGLPAALAAADVVITAVATTGPVIVPAMLAARERETPRLLIDLGVPRNVDPACAEVPGTRVVSVDDLEEVAAETRERYAREIAAVERIVDQAADAFIAWWKARRAAPTIAALRRQAEDVRAHELDRALRKLAHLSERDREVVAALSHAITNKLLHQPITQLRELPHDGAAHEVLAATEQLFGLDGIGD